MAWPDWSKEPNPDILALHRTAERHRVAEFAARKRRWQSERAREMLAALPFGAVSQSSFDQIKAETGIKARALLAIMSEVGREFRGVLGYPASWPEWLRGYVARWIEGRIVAAQFDDQWLGLDSIAVAMMRDEPDVDITNRGLRMALEAHGYKTIRRADGRGIVGYRIKDKDKR